MDETIVNSLIEASNTKNKPSYKMIALRGVVLFPYETAHFDVLRPKSLVALNKAVELGQKVFLVAQKNTKTEKPTPKDIYRIGVIATVKQVIRLNNEGIRVLAIVEERKEIDNYVALEPCFEVTLKDVEEVNDVSEMSMEAVRRVFSSKWDEYRKLNSKITTEMELRLDKESASSIVAVLGNFVLKNEKDKQTLLEMTSGYKQIEFLTAKLSDEIEILTLESIISAKVRRSIEKSQKEFYLREQIKVIQGELGDGEDEIEAYRKKIKSEQLPDYVAQKVEKELNRLQKMSMSSPEAGVIRTYLDTLYDLPWSQKTDDNLDLVKAREILDKEHYGLDKIKERIVEYLAVHQLTQNLKSPILCFVGPPGVGKTSIVTSISHAIGRPLVSMSLGGVKDEAEIRGHRRTYIGALPGRILSGMMTAKVKNPVFLLDEVDKMSSDFRGDPASAMLEVLDINQNSSFIDHYLEIPYDLSQVMFVTTANDASEIPLPLLDRMEVVELSGYTYEEKVQIAKDYLVPKQILASGLTDYNIVFSEEILMEIVRSYTRESGVRSLEREIAKLCRKMAVKIVNKEVQDKDINVTQEMLIELLGVKKYLQDACLIENEVGTANGLAWTQSGGTTLSIEAVLIPEGKGDIQLTGSLGDVMKESCMTALSLVKTLAHKYGIKQEMFSNHNIHLHFPEGATPKDGPSAGITIATALMSAFSGLKVRSDIAMTGEVTLRGKVLPIGGLKEKLLASFRHGIKNIIIPKENEKDLTEMPKEILTKLNIILAEHIETVFDNALVK